MTVRSDAARNRARLLQAAREVFAVRGLGATLDDVARHAGVGTAYRHFPNKHALAAEVLAGATRQIVVDAQDALGIDDPWLALVSFFEVVGARQAADRGLHQALAGQGAASDKADLWPQIVVAVRELFARAHAAGVIRADVRAEDTGPIFAMLGVTFTMGVPEQQIWRRYLALLLDGLRATDRRPLPGTAPVLETFDDLVRLANPDHR